jgi:aerobic-type carbon monoxide dehydrogenase small subunit (CoxS/CutS family)
MASILLTVNGQQKRVEAPPDEALLWVLRNRLEMTGTKYGCGEGQCGACMVLLDGEAQPSCQTPVSEAASRRIVTIEGLAQNGRLHPVQAAFLAEEAFQCGYCTSGMIVASVGLLKTNPKPSAEDIAGALVRNVCRCGTHPRILAALQSVTRRNDGTSK